MASQAPRSDIASPAVACRERRPAPAPRRLPDPSRFSAHCVAVRVGSSVDTSVTGDLDCDLDYDPLSLATAGTHGFFFEDADGFVATSGVAARLTLPSGLDPSGAGDVADWLAAVPTTGSTDYPGTGPIAVGALPFYPWHAAELVVPAFVLVGDGKGARWLTWIGPSTESLPTVEPGFGQRAVADTAQGDLLALRLDPDGATFEAQVLEVLDAVAAGEVMKVVLARQVLARFSSTVEVRRVLRRLQRRERASTVFAQVDGDMAFVGASPELLVHRRGAHVRSHPLAGTRSLSSPVGDAVEAAHVVDRIVAELLEAPKDRAEHQAAADAVASGLAPWCHQLDVPSRPAALLLRDMVHLGTPITGRLRTLPPRPGDASHRCAPADALTLVAALHPTPAVAGVPTAKALAVIDRIEGDRRGLYAGPVGWVDGRGDGTFVVGIRSATITGHHAVLHAGAGIVAGSVPADELAETTAKLATMLGALGVPADHSSAAQR